MCRIIDQNIKKMRIWQSRFSKFSGGACPRTPPRTARASPSQWSLRDHSHHNLKCPDFNFPKVGKYAYTCIGRPTPFLHDCALRCALRRSHLKNLFSVLSFTTSKLSCLDPRDFFVIESWSCLSAKQIEWNWIPLYHRQKLRLFAG